MADFVYMDDCSLLVTHIHPKKSKNLVLQHRIFKIIFSSEEGRCLLGIDNNFVFEMYISYYNMKIA